MTEAVEAILDRFTKLHPKRIDLGLDRINRLLQRLGAPQEKLPPVVHVAGTNGKGSVGAYLRAIFAAAGLSTHSYVSPHLVRFNERILLRGEEIDDGTLATVLLKAEAANASAEITFFEITTCAALLAYAATEADVLLLETGLGGRLDTTNVVARPRLTAITPISLDHQDFLGNDLSSIAAEKAGILKAGVDGVIAAQPAAAMAAIESRAREIGAPLFRRGTEWNIESDGDGFRYEGERWRLALPKPSLIGQHQIDNAGLAVACTERLPEYAVTEEAIARGIAEARWPARLQRLFRGPLVEALPVGWSLWLDGGHNAAAGRVLADVATTWRRGDSAPLKLILGMQANRDPATFLAPLAGVIAELRAVQAPPQDNMHTAGVLAAAAQGLGIEAAETESLAEAVAALTGDGSTGRILICGSLYLAGWVLRDHG